MLEHNILSLRLNYCAFKAVTTLSFDMRQAGYTPDISPKTKQISKPMDNTIKFTES